MKFPGIYWYRACQGSSSKVKDKLLYLGPPTTNAEAQCLVGLFGFWRQYIYSSFGCGTQTHLLSNWKSCSFWVGTRTREGSAIGQGCCASCSFTWAIQFTEPTVPEVAMAEKYVVWSLWNIPIGESQCRPLGFGFKPLSTSPNNYSPLSNRP